MTAPFAVKIFWESEGTFFSMKGEGEGAPPANKGAGPTDPGRHFQGERADTGEMTVVNTGPEFDIKMWKTLWTM